MPFQIFIKAQMAGKGNMTIDVIASDKIKTIKQKIETQKGIPWELQSLKFIGRTLRNGQILSDYNIQKNSTLQLTVIDIERADRCYSRMNGTLIQHTPQIATCPDMIKGKNCSVYNDFIKYQYSEKGLIHLQECSHSGLKLTNCRHGVECKAYIRLVANGNRLDDRCHVMVYSHPPRRNQEYDELDTEMYPFVSGKSSVKWQVNGDNLEEKDEETKSNYNKYVKDWDYPQLYVLKLMDGDKKLLELLIEEIERNSNTTKSTAEDGNWKLDLVSLDGKKLVDIVDEFYMVHPKHVKMGKPLNRAEMLSIVLYTGCYCNYDLCRKQRSGDYRTWAVFDYCLNSAIHKLSAHENGRYPVYSGIGKCQVDFKNVKPMDDNSYYMTTFVSTSYDIKIAKEFLGDTGTLIQFDDEYRYTARAADVSWISKFGEAEKEILFARIQHSLQHLHLEFVNKVGKVQTVSAKGNIRDRSYYADKQYNEDINKLYL